MVVTRTSVGLRVPSDGATQLRVNQEMLSMSSVTATPNVAKSGAVVVLVVYELNQD